MKMITPFDSLVSGNETNMKTQNEFGSLWPDEKWVCPKPGCPQKEPPIETPGCTLKGPLYIAVSPGQHIHIDCPVHGDHIIHGPHTRH